MGEKDTQRQEWVVPMSKVVEDVLNAKTNSGVKSHKETEKILHLRTSYINL